MWPRYCRLWPSACRGKMSLMTIYHRSYYYCLVRSYKQNKPHTSQKDRVGNVIPWSLTALDLLRVDVPSLAQDNRGIPLVLIALTYKFLVWTLHLAFQPSPPPVSPSYTLASPFFSSRNWGRGHFPSLYCPPTWNKCSDHSHLSKMAVTFPHKSITPGYQTLSRKS